LETNGGTFVNLGSVQSLGAEGWSKYLATYLSKLDDDFVLITLDDYLFGLSLDETALVDSMHRLESDPRLLGIKLSMTPALTRPNDVSRSHDGWGKLTLSAGYRLSTQLHLWRRTELLKVLRWTRSAWHFELAGSRGVKIATAASFGLFGSIDIPPQPVARYPEHSALSPKWGNRVNIFGIERNVVEDLVKRDLLKAATLVWGFWPNAPSFLALTGDSWQALGTCPQEQMAEFTAYLEHLI